MRMVSESFLQIYFWGVYAWFVIGAVLIGLPAIKEIANLLKKK